MNMIANDTTATSTPTTATITRVPSTRPSAPSAALPLFFFFSTVTAVFLASSFCLFRFFLDDVGAMTSSFAGASEGAGERERRVTNTEGTAAEEARREGTTVSAEEKQAEAEDGGARASDTVVCSTSIQATTVTTGTRAEAAAEGEEKNPRSFAEERLD